MLDLNRICGKACQTFLEICILSIYSLAIHHQGCLPLEEHVLLLVRLSGLFVRLWDCFVGTGYDDCDDL